MDSFIEAGRALGLEGALLIDFVEKKEKEKMERDDKKEAEKLAREEKKEAERLAREEKLESQPIQREERSKEREIKLAEMQVAEKEKEREFELARRESEIKVQLLEKQIELERLQKAELHEVPKLTHTKHETRAKVPKLPAFNEKYDSMDSYLKRFERFAENAGWDKSNWATSLSALIQGKALDVYSRLSPTDSLNYAKLKDALLKRFQLREEGFRSKFRSSRPKVGETPPQFVVQLDDYLNRWMDMANVSKDFDGLKDLVLREQFMQSSNKNLQVFLKEREVKSVVEMAEVAEQYNEAHGISDSNRPKMQSFTADSRNNKPERKESKLKYVESEKDRYCFYCKSPYHYIKDCPKKAPYSTGKKFVGASGVDEQNFTQVGRGSQRGFTRGNGRIGNRGRGGHNNRFGSRDVETKFDEASEHRSQVGCSISDSCINSGSVKLECGHELPVVTLTCDEQKRYTHVGNLPIYDGFVGTVKVKALRDSGCSSVVVRRDLVSQERMTGSSKYCVLLDGTVRKFPVAKVKIRSPFFSGICEALCAENPVFDLIIGNVEGVRAPSDPDISWETQKSRDSAEVIGAVQTRAQKVKDGKTTELCVPDAISSIDIKQIRQGQQTDDSLKLVRDRLSGGEKKVSSKGDVVWYEQHNGLIYRIFQSPKVNNGQRCEQLVVPLKFRQHVLHLAHDSILAGHQGVRKTKVKVLEDFFWPGVQGDVTPYCRSCDVCQKTLPKGKVPKIPIGELPLIDTPFSRIAIDLIGPIHPPSESGNRFVLTMVDYATRYPEAKALKHIDSISVAESLVQMFCRVGVPREILSDMGKQFTSDIMSEVSRLLSVKQLTSTPYNPACNGLVERFNGTLKTMLKKLCVEKPKQWDRYIDPLLFAYREAPQDSLGFSPFELLYGRTVRGPLSILKELWTEEN